MASCGGKLSAYWRRRDFARTPEPARRGRRQRGGRRFVIQKHDASTLHFDLRLEVDGVLVSWAVPKGPVPDPRRKRLAVRTEDHPLSYGDFEGVIPAHEYGGGTVMLWDRGVYRNLRARGGDKRRSMPVSLRAGLVEVWLEGSKLRGGFALKRLDRGEGSEWLLIKMRDRFADARRRPARTQNRSVKSGRTMHQLRRKTSP